MSLAPCSCLSFNVLNNVSYSALTSCVASVDPFAVKDWGDMDAEDKQTNEDALNYPDDLYLMGAYNTSKGRIWIITNRISETPGDNATTICFPDER